MKKLFQFILMIIMGLVINACYYDAFPEEVNEVIIDDPGDNPTEDVSFQNEIQPIFTSRCIGCHGGTLNPDLREGNSYTSLVPAYVNANNAASSALVIQLENGHQNVPNEDITLIKAWINQGAQDN